MKITALLVLKTTDSAGGSLGSGDSDDPKLLANATDVSHFGFFQRPSAREFIVFVARTLAKRTPRGQRHSVQQEEYFVYCYNKDGLCGLVFADKAYPMRGAFSLINKVLDQYIQTFGNSWKSVTTDANEPWEYLNQALVKYQDPMEADKLLKIQRDLDDTKIILHKTIESVLDRGVKLDSLVEKSTDLSMASRTFYKQAKKTNQCCSLG